MCILSLVSVFAQEAIDNSAQTEVINLEEEYVIGSPNTDNIQSTDENQIQAGEITTWSLIRVILALILVAAIIYGLARVLRRSLVSKESENPFLKKAATLTLAPGKTVQVITMPNKAWLVGVSEAGVNLIGEITDEDLVNQMILEAEKVPQSKARDFASILSSFTNTAKLAEDTIKKQRIRLQRGSTDEK